MLLADEPVSMLDVSIRLEVLDLIDELRSQFELAVLYVTHDIASARYFADDTLVMYAGEIVERGPSEDVTQRPAHPYTQLLVASAPDPDELGGPLERRAARGRAAARRERAVERRSAAALRRAARLADDRCRAAVAAAASGSTRSARRPAGGSTSPHQTCSSKASRRGRRPSRPDRRELRSARRGTGKGHRAGRSDHKAHASHARIGTAHLCAERKVHAAMKPRSMRNRWLAAASATVAVSAVAAAAAGVFAAPAALGSAHAAASTPLIMESSQETTLTDNFNPYVSTGARRRSARRR